MSLLETTQADMLFPSISKIPVNSSLYKIDYAFFLCFKDRIGQIMVIRCKLPMSLQVPLVLIIFPTFSTPIFLLKRPTSELSESFGSERKLIIYYLARRLLYPHTAGIQRFLNYTMYKYIKCRELYIRKVFHNAILCDKLDTYLQL